VMWLELVFLLVYGALVFLFATRSISGKLA
jgi:hypothetical protein